MAVFVILHNVGVGWLRFFFLFSPGSFSYFYIFLLSKSKQARAHCVQLGVALFDDVSLRLAMGCKFGPDMLEKRKWFFFFFLSSALFE